MVHSSSQKLCVFGSFNDSELYPRTRALIDALASLFEETWEVRPDSKYRNSDSYKTLSSLATAMHTVTRSLGTLVSLYRKRAELSGATTYYVPYPAYLDLILLRFLLFRNRRSTIIVDAFLCLHDTIVNDRRLLKSGNPISSAIKWLESETLKRADFVLIDTQQQKDLLIKSYGFSETKFIVSPVGIDESTWTPLPKLSMQSTMHVLFWGTFIPLHGVKTIVDAAAQLSQDHHNIKLTLIGDGQTAESIEKRLKSKNCKTIEWIRELVGTEVIRSQLAKSHVVLGIFGNSDKAANVIPYKAYQALASDKILVTRSGPAIDSLCTSKCSSNGIILVPPDNPEALANSLIHIAENYRDIIAITENRKIYDDCLSNEVIRQKLIGALSKDR